jgi:hypothetical protein
MEITVECPCGTHYQFDVEPVDGKMPVPVACPKCNADGTALSNAFIAAHLAPSAPVSRPAMRLATPPPAPPVDVEAPYSIPRPAPSHRVQAESSGLLLGTIGAVGAGLVGMIGWYLLIKTTGYSIGYAAWGIGVIIGIATKFLARQTSNALGFVAGACAVAAILGGQYLLVYNQIGEAIDQRLSGAYATQLAIAQEAVKAISDDEVRSFLVKHSDATPKKDASQITDQEITNFREKDQPKLKSFADGKLTQVQYEKALRARVRSFISPMTILKESISLFTLLFLFLGVGSAYKIASG